ncbi:hypothetical protein N5P37_005589 [Trichoderma harzianum]|nr:hypothetical protein N5P37_005589 [Trichoderma harzianum]
MSAQEYYNSASSSDSTQSQPQYYDQQQYNTNGNYPQQGTTPQQQLSQAPPFQGYDANSRPPANLNGQPQHDHNRDQNVTFTQQFPLGTAPGSEEANGERGLGAAVVGGGIGAFAAKKSGGGLLGAIGGAAAGAIGANMLEHAYNLLKRRIGDTSEENIDMVAAVIDTTALCIMCLRARGAIWSIFLFLNTVTAFSDGLYGELLDEM